MGEENFPKRTMLVAVHLGLIILSSIVWSTVTCHEYKNYPIQVHQMFQERVQHSLRGGDRARGNWGSWAAWSDCSRSCGTGVQSQSRECVPAREHLRKRSIAIIEEEKPEVEPLCIGTYKRYHVCNTQECPNFGDLRTEQCAKYNGKFYKGQSYQWEPFPDAPNECALNCRAVGERFYATLEPEVVDGTPCRGISRGRTRLPGVLAVGIADHWICVAGQCKTVGCDGVVGSGRVLDACGICGGEGNGCKLFEGIFLEPRLEKGYQLVTTIPRGAVSLNVSELRQSNNALALRDSNSSFLLNGPSSPSVNGIYKGAGTSFTYHRGDAMHAENIWAEGPLGEAVDLMILTEELNPGILYKFMLPLNERIEDSAMMAPPILVAGPNDKIDNEIPQESDQLAMPPKPKILDGERTRIRSEREKGVGGMKGRGDNHGITTMAGDQPMQQTQVVTKDRKRKKNNKKFYWKIGGLAPCSKACGGGVQYPTFKCFRESTHAIAPERRCKRVPRPPSPPPMKCNTRPCPARWRAGPWSPCSVTCGFGTQTRKLECVQELNPKLTMRVALGACIEKTDLKTTMQCKQAPCTFPRVPKARQIQPSQVEPTPNESQWQVSPWETCSNTCGSGIRKRKVTCITAGDTTCLPETKPANETTCDGLPECKKMTELKAPWLYTDWSSQCSAECGIGLQTRQIACNDGNEVFCDATKKPSLEKNCNGTGTDCNDRIRYQWFVGAWSTCTVSCGSGVLRRDVICISSINGELKINDEQKCSKLTRPIAEERCLQSPCPAEWFTSDWSECTKTCGVGLQTRVVRCLREGVQSSGCSETLEPKTQKVCDNQACKLEDDAEGPAKPPKKVHDEKTAGDCVDKYPNCNLVVKAGLCRINYYKHSCCSCR